MHSNSKNFLPKVLCSFFNVAFSVLQGIHQNWKHCLLCKMHRTLEVKGCVGYNTSAGSPVLVGLEVVLACTSSPWCKSAIRLHEAFDTLDGTEGQPGGVQLMLAQSHIGEHNGQL